MKKKQGNRNPNGAGEKAVRRLRGVDCNGNLEALMESGDIWRFLVEHASDVIMIVDEKGIIRFINHVVSGFTQESVIGTDNSDYINPDYRDLVKSRIREVFVKGESSSYEVPGVGPDEEASWYLTQVVPLRQAGRVVFAMLTATDITRRIKAEYAVVEERNKLRLILDAIHCGATIVDLDYNIIYQNELLKKIFGDRLRDKCYRVYEGEDKVCKGCLVEKAYKDGEEQSGERPIKLPSGEIGAWDISAIPIRDGEGQVIACLEIAINVTRYKNALIEIESSRKKLQKKGKELEQKNIALREMLALLDIEKKVVRDNILTNVTMLILPIVNDLRNMGNGIDGKYLDLLEGHLKQLTSSFGTRITDLQLKLTIRERRICDLIKGGLTTKEIAKVLDISPKTVESFRTSIRKKLGIQNKSINLPNYLQTL